MYRKPDAEKRWEAFDRITDEKWGIFYRRNPCYECGGEGSYIRGGYQENPTLDSTTCEACGGTGDIGGPQETKQFIAEVIEDKHHPTYIMKEQLLWIADGCPDIGSRSLSSIYRS